MPRAEMTEIAESEAWAIACRHLDEPQWLEMERRARKGWIATGLVNERVEGGPVVQRLGVLMVNERRAVVIRPGGEVWKL